MKPHNTNAVPSLSSYTLFFQLLANAMWAVLLSLPLFVRIPTKQNIKETRVPSVQGICAVCACGSMQNCMDVNVHESPVSRFPQSAPSLLMSELGKSECNILITWILISVGLFDISRQSL